MASKLSASPTRVLAAAKAHFNETHKAADAWDRLVASVDAEHIQMHLDRARAALAAAEEALT